VVSALAPGLSADVLVQAGRAVPCGCADRISDQTDAIGGLIAKRVPGPGHGLSLAVEGLTRGANRLHARIEGSITTTKRKGKAPLLALLPFIGWEV
jgi:hypothetical protein